MEKSFFMDLCFYIIPAPKAIAISTGKNTAKTGIKIVPRPNPEKNVRMAVIKATILITIKSISFLKLKQN